MASPVRTASGLRRVLRLRDLIVCGMALIHPAAPRRGCGLAALVGFPFCATVWSKLNSAAKTAGRIWFL
ncbi:MAG: hypothetical protein LC130_12245 [Bryobacterales bacterium]|nr:hypothetical protein [Bryobacterales bacterium]